MKVGDKVRSRPARGAWIEMSGGSSKDRMYATSRPARGAWIEIKSATRK